MSKKSKGFLYDLAEKYSQGEISRAAALDLIVDTYGVHREGASELLDGCVDDLRFFPEEWED